MKIIWMSDPHFQNEGTIAGLNPRARLDAALEHANGHYPDAAFIVMSGDLVGDDIVGDYTALKARFATSDLQVYPMVGNNDDRAAFLEMVDVPKTVMPGFAQYQIETDEGVVICLDTHKPRSSAGEFCDARLAWLQDALDESGERPAYVFMHHPPCDVGIEPMDRIRVLQSETFTPVFAQYKNDIRHIFFGHIHRPLAGSWMTIPLSAVPSLNHQVALDFTATGDAIDFSHESPAYAVVLIQPEQMLVHLQSFTYEKGTYPSAVHDSAEDERSYALGMA